jgi:hypothetical protein
MSGRGLLALALLLLPAAPAQAAVSNNIVVTGTEGRDDVTVQVEGDFTFSQPDKGSGFLITPAVAVSGPSTNNGPICTPVNDPLTGRPSGTRCRAGINDRFVFVFDLKGGNDGLFFRTENAPIDSVTVAGGAGDDLLIVIGSALTALVGDDGDDTLASPVVASRGVNFDGGAGRDLVDYGGQSTRATGVTANLASGVATTSITGDGQTGSANTTFVRTDAIKAVERISGTSLGDILTGGAGADELLGIGGEDILDGGDGNDTLSGGDGSDLLKGNKGADVNDGGAGIDEFTAGSGGDTYMTRDGFAEKLTCIDKDIVVDDLVDKVTDPLKCQTISTAAAKHHFDTILARRAPNFVARLTCPAEKTERCTGRLSLRLRSIVGPVLATARYSIPVGRRARIHLRLTTAERARLRGRAAVLDATETDADGRARRITVRLLR